MDKEVLWNMINDLEGLIHPSHLSEEIVEKFQEIKDYIENS
jgi:hypothetical protein